MDSFVKFLANVRLGITELGGTLTFLGLIAFGTYMAWKDFIAPLLR
jgi:hypothetical protein